MAYNVYTEHRQSCCIPTLDNCKTCQEKDDCSVSKEQLAFYGRLGISQVDDDIDINSLEDLRGLFQFSNRNKREEIKSFEQFVNRLL